MPDNPPTPAEKLSFRGIQHESDYALLLEINRSSRLADNNPQIITLDEIKQAYAQTATFDPAANVLIAFLAKSGTPVGYSRLGWYSNRPTTRLYFQVSFLLQACRERGLWTGMVQRNEAVLGDIASRHPVEDEKMFIAWASDSQADWAGVLADTGYRVVRRFNNMLHTLDEIPARPMPPGLEVRPVLPENMRAIWEAQKEMNDGLFENVAGDWLEEAYPAWLANPAHAPNLWQAAWDGTQLAGMVLARIDPDENPTLIRRHGYTEHVFVRPAYRKRGLASALVTRSLQVLKDQGMNEAELGVDSENESGAFQLYTSLGYKTFSVDTWYGKALN